MITAGNTDKRAEVFITPGVKFEFAGLSFDHIPVGTFDGTPIGNNSTFYAIDIDRKYYYHDGEWVPVGWLPTNLTDEETVRLVRWIWGAYTGEVFLLASADEKPGLDVASAGDFCYERDTGKGYICDEYGVWTEMQRPYNYGCLRPWAQDHDVNQPDPAAFELLGLSTVCGQHSARAAETAVRTKARTANKEGTLWIL